MRKKFYQHFDESTELKLEILSKYLEKWLPVFLMNQYTRKIKIIDFFCGPGRDEQNNEGSPIKIIQVFKKFMINYKAEIKKKNIQILFNDNNEDHINSLKTYISENYSEEIKSLIRLESKKFKDLFNEIKTDFYESANFLFLDQFGVKEVTKDIFTSLFNLPRTDFLFFISSISIKRFLRTSAFKELRQFMDSNKVKLSKSKDIHRTIGTEYKRLVTPLSYVIPFTIKKKRNIYGLVFCSQNIRAADKFLEVVWNKNEINGEANFDINEDTFHQQLSLFEKEKLTKVETFQKTIQEEILNLKITTNIEAYKYTISNGYLPKHAREVIKNLKENNKIDYNGHLSLSYKSCIKNEKIVKFIIKT